MATVKNEDLGLKKGARVGIKTVVFAPLNAALAVDANGFIADQAYRLIRAEEAHAVVGGASAAVDVKKCTGTQAPSAGTTMLTSTFDLTATVNTVVNKTLTATEANREIAAGDRICLDFSGTVTGLAGCTVVLHLLPLPDRRYWKTLG